VLTEWRGSLAYAPMGVEYVPDIRNQDIHRLYESEEKARRGSWYFRTLVFCMFAEFAYVTAVKSNWRQDLNAYCKQRGLNIDEGWVDEIAGTICDFKRTKRAGVIINIHSFDLWPVIRRYHENGVPVLMEFGRVDFLNSPHYISVMSLPIRTTLDILIGPAVMKFLRRRVISCGKGTFIASVLPTSRVVLLLRKLEGTFTNEEKRLPGSIPVRKNPLTAYKLVILLPLPLVILQTILDGLSFWTVAGKPIKRRS
jgi:hypothetical protein